MTVLTSKLLKERRYSVWAILGIMCVFLLSSLILLALLFHAYLFSAQDHLLQWPKPSFSPLGIYSKAAVATDNVYCSEIGRNTLLRGGNAVDAAIASLWCIGVMDTHSTGISGGHFMIVYNASTRECHAIDARHTAPAAAFKDMYKNEWEKSQLGWKAVGIPGELHGMFTAFTKFGSGKISWNDVMQPTIELVQEGYPTSHILANALKEKAHQILNEPTMKDFINPATGKLYKRGEQIKTRTAFLKTLKRLQAAENPVKEFYNSTMTKAIVKEFKERGGIITYDDFKNYRSIVYQPSQMITAQLRNDFVIYGPPPPSSSALTGALISIMDEYDYNPRSIDGLERFYHHFIEASKHVYAWRSWLGDPKFVANSAEIARNITKKEWADYIRAKITDTPHPDAYYGGKFVNEDHGTSHISVIDAAGNAVAVTSTLNTFFGAKVTSISTGILWNNQMDDFSIPGHPNYYNFAPSPANFIEPGKRPLSSMSPLILRNAKNNKMYVFGGEGGSKIIGSVAGAVLHILKLGASVKEAIDAPRLHNQLTPNCTTYEEKFPLELIQRLKNRGHTLCQKGKNESPTILTGICKQAEDQIFANSDFRKGEESAPAGY